MSPIDNNLTWQYVVLYVTHFERYVFISSNELFLIGYGNAMDGWAEHSGHFK